MDLEDNETVRNSFDGQVEQLKETIESLEAQLAHNQTQVFAMEARLEDSKAQVGSLKSIRIICATEARFNVSMWQQHCHHCHELLLL